MKVLLDTNIILDVALQRQPYFDESDQVLSLVEQRRVEGYVSASTFSDLYYLIRKERGREWALSYLRGLAIICRIAAVNEAAIAMALTSNFRDFELNRHAFPVLAKQGGVSGGQGLWYKKIDFGWSSWYNLCHDCYSQNHIQAVPQLRSRVPTLRVEENASIPLQCCRL